MYINFILFVFKRTDVFEILNRNHKDDNNIFFLDNTYTCIYIHMQYFIQIKIVEQKSVTPKHRSAVEVQNCIKMVKLNFKQFIKIQDISIELDGLTVIIRDSRFSALPFSTFSFNRTCV